MNILIFISWKRSKAVKGILKANINNGKCDNMGNTNETVIYIPLKSAQVNICLSFISVTI